MPWSTAASSSGDGQLRVMGLRMVVRSLGLRGAPSGVRARVIKGLRAYNRLASQTQ